MRPGVGVGGGQHVQGSSTGISGLFLMLALPRPLPLPPPPPTRSPLTSPAHTHPLLAAPRNTNTTGKQSGNPVPKLSDEEKLLGRGKKNHFIVSAPGSFLENKNKIKPQLERLYLAKFSRRGPELNPSLEPQRGGAGRPGSLSHGAAGAGALPSQGHLLPKQLGGRAAPLRELGAWSPSRAGI